MNKRMVLSFAVMVVLSACSAGGISNETLEKDVQANTHLTDVHVTKVTQQYQDTGRSPDDTGTTYVVEANFKSDGASESAQSLQVFVAKSDGFIIVEQKNKYGDTVPVR